MKEFPMHTDGSFEEPPPAFVALYCVEEDKLGGGETLFVEAHKIKDKLSEQSLQVLQEFTFKLKIPTEFSKGKDSTEAHLLAPNGHFRFRRDIVMLDGLAPPAVQAVEELDSLINSPEHAEGINLRKGEIVAFDNGRFFHGRKKIEDQTRHLKRMWFHLGS
jgi:alpha-ketoglutarate-dependent taurine dioxygenase